MVGIVWARRDEELCVMTYDGCGGRRLYMIKGMSHPETREYGGP